MSDQYLVSARKYRPQSFDTVVGQEHITTTLKNAMRKHQLAHAFLFCGPRGVGKTTCARILAKTLNCENQTAEMEACGICSNCQSFSNNTSFNVFELDAASNNSVDDIRALTEQVRFAPQQGKYKVYIIDEVHMLSTAAFNAFLKTLEEPPSYCIFILATTEKHKILPTILSRCQIFDFKRITTNDTVVHLQKITTNESIIADEAALHIIAQKSEGCMRDALSILDRISSFTNGDITYAATMEHLNQLDANFYFSITDSILAGDVSNTLLMLNDVLERGFEGDVIINSFAEHFRNLLLCKDARMAKLLDVPNNHKPIYHEKALQCPPAFILSALNILNESELNYKNANNRRLHTELCLIRLCYLLQATKELSEVKKKDDLSPKASIVTEESKTEYSEKKQAPATNQSVSIPEPKPAIQADSESIVRTNVPSNIVANPTNKVRRISRDMTTMLAQENVQAQKMNLSEVSLEMVQQLFDTYKCQLKEENKSILFSAFEQVTITMPEEGTIHLISPNSMVNENVIGEKSNLQDMLKEATGLILRITNDIELKEVISNEKILSKTEIFDEMANKNPLLLHFKDALKMGIEY